MRHGEHARNVKQRSPRSRVKGTGYHLDHLVLDPLEHFDEALSCAREEPQLASPQHNRQAYSVKHKLPVSHGETANRVSQDLQRLDRRASPVAHDSYVGLPFELPVDEEPKVSDVLRQQDHVVSGVCRIRKDQPCGSRQSVVLIWLLEEEQFRFLQLDSKTRSMEPFFADRVMRSEQHSDVCPLLCACKEKAVVHIHAQRGVIPTSHLEQ